MLPRQRMVTRHTEIAARLEQGIYGAVTSSPKAQYIVLKSQSR
jgi:hypothetical protein